jgi:hypothetical protein
MIQAVAHMRKVATRALLALTAQTMAIAVRHKSVLPQSHGRKVILQQLVASLPVLKRRWNSTPGFQERTVRAFTTPTNHVPIMPLEMTETTLPLTQKPDALS